MPGLEGSEYGRTLIKALLQMSSGVAFSEVYRATSPRWLPALGRTPVAAFRRQALQYAWLRRPALLLLVAETVISASC
jgi:hypothetical protein